MLLHPPRSTLFPYTTLFRSVLRTVRVRRHLNLVVRRRGAFETDFAGDGGVRLRHVKCRAAGSTRSPRRRDRKSTRLNSSHVAISYAVFCLKKKITHRRNPTI